jgi:UPF0176 protein
MPQQQQYRVLLYYKFLRIDNHEAFAEEHLQFCKELGLHGRILIAPEGINGTVSGTPEQTEQYMNAMHRDARFADMWFKIDEVEDHVFRKMFVRAKDELVTFRVEDSTDPNELTGQYLSPKEFYELLDREDVVVLDGRSDYEWDLGHFKNAIRPGVKSFREFPDWIRENMEQFKDKKVLTYCTGGIRCEKLTGFMIKEGFKDVAQLHGGIVTYGKDPEVRGKSWVGKCYVFDERISVPINSAEEYQIVSTCLHCGDSCDRYVNCANLDCHKQHFCCEKCEPLYRRSCSTECMDAPVHRHEWPAETSEV